MLQLSNCPLKLDAPAGSAPVNATCDDNIHAVVKVAKAESMWNAVESSH